MSKELTRYFASSFTSSDIEGFRVLNNFVYPAASDGQFTEKAEQEHVRWLISKNEMENLYNLLRKELGKD
ncbi:hypothetical protein ABRP57_09545 [Pectobacterium aroidearum]|uniref:hypothetical protein n=1 Tax=Pectobacterium aroidearum TaxID=1201031 RepID=UPI0032ED0478